MKARNILDRSLTSFLPTVYADTWLLPLQQQWLATVAAEWGQTLAPTQPFSGEAMSCHNTWEKCLDLTILAIHRGFQNG